MVVSVFRTILGQKKKKYFIFRIISLIALIVLGTMVMLLEKPILRLVVGCGEYLVFLFIVLVVERRYALYKMSLFFLDKYGEEKKNNKYYRSYINAFAEEYSDDWDIPVYGLHSAFHGEEIRKRFLIAGFAMVVPGGIGLIWSIIERSFPIFLIGGGVAGLVAMYLDAYMFTSKMEKTYVDLYCKTNNISEEKKKLIGRKLQRALMYSWGDCKNGEYLGLDNPEDWEEASNKNNGSMPRIPQVLREVVVSAHKRLYEKNKFFSLMISVVGLIIMALVNCFCVLFPEFYDYLSIECLPTTSLTWLTFVGVVAPLIYYLFQMMPVLGKKLTILNGRKASLYEKYYLLRYISYFESWDSLREVIRDMKQANVIIQIDFARGKYDYGLATVLGVYADKNRYFEKPELINKIEDKFSRLAYLEQAYGPQREKGQIVISLVMFIVICIGWTVGSIGTSFAGLIGGAFLILFWNKWLYRRVLPLPSIDEMQKRIDKLKKILEKENLYNEE